MRVLYIFADMTTTQNYNIQSMLRNAFYLLVSVFFLSGCARSRFTASDTDTNPGYYKQWFDEHKNERGEIPEGLVDQWYAHDRMLISNNRGGGETPITTVTNLSNNILHGGRTRAILVSSIDSNKIFAGSVSGGLWRSMDGGQSWQAINDQSANLAVSCITENPYNPNEIYYGTGEVRGSSVGAGNGVYKSTDGGMTFERLPSTAISDMGYCNLIVHSVTDSSTVWLGTSRGLFYSKNSGATWTKLPVLNYSNSSVSGIISFPDSSLMVSLQGVKIFKTPKPTTSPFAVLTDSLFPKTSIGRILISNCANAYPNTVYAFFTNSAGLDASGSGPSANLGIFKSTDGGSSWKRMSTQTLNIGSTQSNYCVMLGVHPKNPDFVVLGAQFAAYSRNGGVNFTSFNSGHADNHVYSHFGKGDGNDFFVGNDGGIYKGNFQTLAGGSKDMSKGYTTAQYYAGNYGPTGINCISGSQDNGTWRYSNGVATKFFGGDGAYSHISQQNPNILYCATQNGKTYFKNGNANQVDVTPGTAVSEGVDFINQFEMNYADGNQLYYRSNKGIWRSINNGVFWEKLNKTTISNINAIGVTRDADPTVYLGGSGIFYRIENAATRAAGQTLKNLASLLPANMRSSVWGTISFHPSDKTTMFVGLTTISSLPRAWKGMYVNTDTMKWVSISGNLPKNLSVYQVQAHPDAPETIFFAATDFGLYYTLDGGQNWEKETRMPNVAIFEMKLRPEDKKLFLFTHGRSAWFLELKDLSVVKANDKELIADWNLYPNPASDFIQVELTGEITSAQIFDVTGRELLSVQNTAQIDISQLQKGTYLMKIFDRNGKYALRKFVKN